MKIIYASLLSALLMISTSCSDDQDSDLPKSVDNVIEGTWKGFNSDSSYWFQFVFNKDYSGIRTDSDNEYTEFKYELTPTEIHFLVGIPGNFRYELINSNTLLMFGDTLTRQ